MGLNSFKKRKKKWKKRKFIELLKNFFVLEENRYVDGTLLLQLAPIKFLITDTEILLENNTSIPKNPSFY
ncbi:MAG: hypothetical protein KJI71_01460 [Patescibacteria group bacterium]|nr:hypothetical protein [Patescibacteria group bacterium]